LRYKTLSNIWLSGHGGRRSVLCAPLRLSSGVPASSWRVCACGGSFAAGGAWQAALFCCLACSGCQPRRTLCLILWRLPPPHASFRALSCRRTVSRAAGGAVGRQGRGRARRDGRLAVSGGRGQHGVARGGGGQARDDGRRWPKPPGTNAAWHSSCISSLPSTPATNSYLTSLLCLSNYSSLYMVSLPSWQND